ncbi:MAG: CDP-alcohol phosphatidyltransferase family protein, partial [Gemmatimonadales bacterium]
MTHAYAAIALSVPRACMSGGTILAGNGFMRVAGKLTFAKQRMLDPALRKLKDRSLDPVARALGPHISPIIVSLFSLVAGLAASFAAFQAAYWMALGFWLLNRLFDGLDGSLARVHARQTDLGGYLDILFDFAVYAALPVAIVMGMPPSEIAYVALVLLLGSYYLNAASWMYLSAILEKRNNGS